MVCFTCQHCGNSLQKNKVEKHYMFQCRKEPFVTCIDCLKDFRGKEYVEHTKCVTESERYGGKDYVSKVNPNDLKRENWLSSVEKAAGTPGLPKAQKDLIGNILACPNIPQKRPKFINFVKSTLARSCPPIKVLEDVFDLLVKTHKTNLEQEKNKNNDSVENKSNETNTNEGQSEENENSKKRKLTVDDEVVDESETVEKPKKKKKKRKIEDGETAENQNNEFDESNTQLNESGNTSLVNGNVPGEVDSATKEEPEKTLSRKEKKEKRKREKYEAELNEIENFNKENGNDNEDVADTNENADNCTKKKKKKKDKNQNTNDENLKNEQILNENNIKKKKKCAEESEEPAKKKLKAAEANDAENGEENDVANENVSTFKWDEMIIKVLQSRSDQELSLNRLSKKLINEYYAIYGENHMTTEKLMAKFTKKIYKTSGVKVLKDKAILVNS